jgi:hypothetical protein
MSRQVFMSAARDPRLVTVRRGGTLEDADHHLLAVWAADCGEHVLHLFEQAQLVDDRPRRAIELARAWARGEITMTQARTAAFAAHAAARWVSGAAREAAHAAGQAVAVAHVAPTSWGQRPTRSGPHARRLPRASARMLVAWSASGSVTSFPARSGNSCSTTSGCAIRSAGPSSAADQFARNRRRTG